jgi:uncharacterized protein (DUF433 family)
MVKPAVGTADPLERIEIDPEVMLGKPVIRGTRITVEIILEKIAAGFSVEDILSDYPRLTRDDVLAAVAYARQAIGCGGTSSCGSNGALPWRPTNGRKSSTGRSRSPASFPKSWSS